MTSLLGVNFFVFMCYNLSMKAIILFSLLSLSVFGEEWSKTRYVNLVANTLYKEAGGESCEGIRLVADVIVNRSKGDKNAIPFIILSPKQFSCWNGKNGFFSCLRSRSCFSTASSQTNRNASSSRFSRSSCSSE